MQECDFIVNKLTYRCASVLEAVRRVSRNAMYSNSFNIEGLLRQDGLRKFGVGGYVGYTLACDRASPSLSSSYKA